MTDSNTKSDSGTRAGVARDVAPPARERALKADCALQHRITARHFTVLELFDELSEFQQDQLINLLCNLLGATADGCVRVDLSTTHSPLP